MFSRVRTWILTITIVIALGAIPGSVGRAGLFFGNAPPVPADVVDRDSTLIVNAKDEANHPLGDAVVVVLAIVEGVAYEAGRATTDANGVVRLEKLPRGDAWVLANASGRARASSHLLLVGERAIDLVLLPEQSFDVTVRDAEGKPIADATIEARGAEPLPVGATTDPQGRAHVGRLGAGPWSVTIRKDGYDSATERAKDHADLAITLRRLGSILVHVFDPDGNPARDARVQIAGSSLWPAREGKTGEHGMVKLAGLYSGSYAVRSTWKMHASNIEISIALGPGEEKEVELRLLPGRMVTVLVVDSDEQDAQAVVGARIVLAEGGLSPFPLEALSDRSGHATLGPIAPGTAFVSARADAYVARAILVPEPLTGEVKVVLAKAGSLGGRVVDARGFPIAGATLEVVGTDYSGGPISDDPKKSRFRDAQFDAVLPGPSALIASGELGVLPGPVPPIPRASERVLGFTPPGAPSLDPPWVTKNDGSFDLSPVTPGRVRVLVHHPEFVEALSDVVSLSPGGRVGDITITLRKGGDLEGRVIDTSGRPVAGARLEVVATRGSFARTTRTATDGTFAFSSVPDACSVDVYRDEDALHPSTRVTTLVPEDGKRQLTVTLPEARESASVSVHDGRGDPIAAAQLTLLSLDPSVPLRETSFADEKGEAVVAGALGLPVRIEVHAPGRAPKIVIRDSLPAHVDVTLDAGIIATGEVRPARGNEPLSASLVFYTDIGSTPITANPDGSFEVRDLAAGPARVAVHAPGYATLEKSLVLTATSSGRPLDLGRFELQAEASVDGTVMTDRGDPVAGARVAKDRAPVFLAAGVAVGVAVTDSKGRFHLGELAEGNVWIEAYAPDVGTGRATVRVVAGRTASDVRIVLVASGKSGKEPASTGSVAITLGETNSDPRQVVVVGVAANSEAERAGIQPDDVIDAIDGVSVSTIEDARAKLSGAVEQDVVIKVVRQGKSETLRVGREAVRR